MIIIEQRHKPVFSMSIIKNICKFAELNFFKLINERFKEGSLSLETTVRINEVNLKILNKENTIVSNKNYDQNLLDCMVDDAIFKLNALAIDIDDFFNDVIQFDTVCDLSTFPAGNYIFYSLDGAVPDLSTCHAFFAIGNNCMLEVALNRFEKMGGSTSPLIIGVITI